MGTGVGDHQLSGVRVVLDAPRRQSVLRLRGRFGSWVGGSLSALGYIATSGALVYTGVWLLNGETKDRHVQYANLAKLAAVWAVALCLGWVGRRGLRLMRGNRRLVLFLRRFGHTEAIDAISFACATIGRRWRLVTLDDAAIAPVRITPAVGRTAGAAYRVRQRMVKLAKRLYRIGMILLCVCIPALAIIFVIVPDADIATEFTLPPHSLIGFVFWPFAAGFFVVFFGTGIALAVGAALLPFYQLNPLLDAVVEADGSATARVRTPADIETAATMVAQQSRKILSPKLTVLTVESAIWQPTVRRLAAVSAVCLVDVSRPTEHLLWEIEQLTTVPGADCVFVGHVARLRRFTGGPGVEVLAVAPDSVTARLERHLAGKEVLGYTTDPEGLERFTRALHTRLESNTHRFRRQK